MARERPSSLSNIENRQRRSRQGISDHVEIIRGIPARAETARRGRGDPSVTGQVPSALPRNHVSSQAKGRDSMRNTFIRHFWSRSGLAGPPERKVLGRVRPGCARTHTCLGHRTHLRARRRADVDDRRARRVPRPAGTGDLERKLAKRVDGIVGAAWCSTDVRRGRAARVNRRAHLRMAGLRPAGAASPGLGCRRPSRPR